MGSITPHYLALTPPVGFVMTNEKVETLAEHANTPGARMQVI
jgi:hypothetical protein